MSERSLELNVMSEAVDYVRRVYGKAYLVGYTTRQEANHGIDVSIDAPGKIVAAFQFKAPRKRYGDAYEFVIGEKCWVCSNPNIKGPRELVAKVLGELGLSDNCANQHMLLFMMALVLKHSINLDVYYALPLMHTYSELEQRVPNLLRYTVLIPVLTLPRTLLDCRKHIISIRMPGGNVNSMTITVSSEPIELPRKSYTILDELLKKKLEREEELPEAKQEIHISIDELKRLLKEALSEDIGKEKREKLAEGLTKISFSYRGTALVAKKTTEKTQ